MAGSGEKSGKNDKNTKVAGANTPETGGGVGGFGGLFLRFWHHLCMVFTVGSMAILLLNLALTDAMDEKLLTIPMFLRLFLYAAVCAIAHLFYRSEHAPCGARLAVHFLLTAGGLYCILYLPAGVASGSSGKLMMAFLLIALYWLVMAGYLLLTSSSRRSRGKGRAAQDEYRNVFKK